MQQSKYAYGIQAAGSLRDVANDFGCQWEGPENSHFMKKKKMPKT